VLDNTVAGDVSLAYTRLFVNGKSLGIWFIGHNESHKDVARNLRICLFRLHAERQVLSQILRWVIQGVIQYQPHSHTGDALEQYINNATRVIFQQNRDGLSQDPICNILTAYDWVMSPGEIDVLLKKCKDIRKQVFEKLDRFLSQQDSGKRHTCIINYKNFMQEGVQLNMSNGTYHTTSINYGTGNKFYGDVTAGENISDSFNVADKASKKEIKDALQQLTKSIAELCEKLDPNEQQKVSRKLKALSEEVVASEPDKSFLKVTGEGLIDATKTVAEMIGPITTAVKGILTLVGIVL
jgi:hypothetical protein